MGLAVHIGDCVGFVRQGLTLISALSGYLWAASQENRS